MLIYKGLLAIGAAALGASLVLALPGFSPKVEAGTPAPVVKSDRMDVRAFGPACSKQAWPYYEAGCLRGPQHGARQSPIRLVSTDRIAAR